MTVQLVLPNTNAIDMSTIATIPNSDLIVKVETYLMY